MTAPPSLASIKAVLERQDLFSPLDRQFGRFAARLARNHTGGVALAAALVSRAAAAGNTCLDLDAYGGRVLPGDTGEAAAPPPCPETAAWQKLLLESGVVGVPGETRPLVLSGSRLYLHRYWQHENVVCTFIRERGSQRPAGIDHGTLRRGLARLFPAGRDANTDWQQVAAVAALTNSFTVISGGPGTGKTTTAAKILALLAGQHRHRDPLRILLGAPTGKAAARLQETINGAGFPETGTGPLQGATIHRLLGPRPGSTGFRHNRDNPLEADIVIIDEASMVDLVLMARLMEAVPAKARLILLGDHHQLASVQPGSVLGDICQPQAMQRFSAPFRRLVAELTGQPLPPHPGETPADSGLCDCFVELVQPYRFAPDSGLSRLAAAIRDGDCQGVLAALQAGRDSTVSWTEVPDGKTVHARLRRLRAAASYTPATPEPDPATCFAALEDFRILAVLRQGPCGVTRLNALLGWGGAKKAWGWQPLLVSRNDYALDLFNGDVGILLEPTGAGKAGRVFFRQDGVTLREIALPLLPDHETAFAMTVHKSQGSEFRRVLLILPERDSPLLSRELLYTAVTRARETVEIWGRQDLLVAALTRPTARSSGLAPALWPEGA